MNKQPTTDPTRTFLVIPIIALLIAGSLWMHTLLESRVREGAAAPQ